MAGLLMAHKTATEQAEQHLLNLITEGVLRPGQPLHVDGLCEQYGFTHTPLREAMRSLAAQGLLEYTANRGYRVASVTDEECVALFEVREALEGMAARKAAEYATEEQLHEIMAVAIDCDEMLEQDPDQVRRATVDIRFHRLVVEASGNPVLPRILLAPAVLAGSIASYGADTKPVPVFRGVLEVTHEAVADAIASRDPVHAEAVMRAHIQEVARRVRSRREAQDAAEPPGC